MRPAAALAGALAALALIVAAGWLVEAPVRSLVPYAVVVGWASWHAGSTAGFVFAGLASAAALVAGALPSRPQWAGLTAGEGLATYLKLSAVALGATLGRRLARM